jgi:hypothetical protein
LVSEQTMIIGSILQRRKLRFGEDKWLACEVRSRDKTWTQFWPQLQGLSSLVQHRWHFWEIGTQKFVVLPHPNSVGKWQSLIEQDGERRKAELGKVRRVLLQPDPQIRCVHGGTGYIPTSHCMDGPNRLGKSERSQAEWELCQPA